MQVDKLRGRDLLPSLLLRLYHTEAEKTSVSVSLPVLSCSSTHTSRGRSHRGPTKGRQEPGIPPSLFCQELLSTHILLNEQTTEYSEDSGAVWGLSVFPVMWAQHRSGPADSSSSRQLKQPHSAFVFSGP